MHEKNVNDEIPQGLTLRHMLQGHTVSINQIAWSSDGLFLASASFDNTIRLWDVQANHLLQKIVGYSSYIYSIAWSLNGRIIAYGSDGRFIQLCDAQTGRQLRTLIGHSDAVNSLAWSPDGEVLASASSDRTIHLWNPNTGQHLRTLESHTGTVTGISFSYDGRLFASKSRDNTVRIWRTDLWQTIATLEESSSSQTMAGLAFHPNASILATLGEENTAIRIWDLNIITLLSAGSVMPSVHYANAKVILVGDSGVGKSGLGLVLTSQRFVPTESTHGRLVWFFDSQEAELDGEQKEIREVLLWDLAGQPGYRLIHQLYLNEVSIALLVFDSHSETDPFAGIYHWVRALRMAQRAQGNSAPIMKIFLVAARIDRGGRSVSRGRINALIQELGFDGYFETSAKEGWNITVLADTIKHTIDWVTLAKVTSTDLFQRIKMFLVLEKKGGRLLSTTEDLYRAFQKSEENHSLTKDLHAQFETCIRRVESRGLIRRLSFGNLVLLQPELLDAYASSLINAVKDEPDGLGSIAEEKVRLGDFLMLEDERIPDKEQEKLLLIAMVEDMLRHEIALREQGEDGPYLVFPSQSTREHPDLADPQGKTIVFSFEGPVPNIYATLAVRLSYSDQFMKKELWKNAVTYTPKLGGTCGIFLNNIGEGRAELILFFDGATSRETRFHFEEYVKTHLQRRALPETIKRRRIIICPNCGLPLGEQHVKLRLNLGFDWIRCNVCDREISLLDESTDRFTVAPDSLILKMDQAADSQRERQTAQSILQGKIETKDFDVFLCHNGKNKAAIKKIGEQLKERGILPWLDEWELRPGLPWQRLLEKQIEQIKSSAVFVGRDGTGPWQDMELYAFLLQFVKRECPVIPVILPNCKNPPKLPLFLEGMTWVDFRKQKPVPIEQLIWGITGKRSTLR